MTSTIDQRFLLVLRLLMAWTFLYAAAHQVFDPNFSIVGFLSTTKTFHGLFSLFTGPVVAPIVGAMVAYGHLAIGLSLLFGCLVRISALFGALVLMMYWMAHMDFPYISDANNFLVDYHIVYSVVLVYLSVKGRRQGLRLRRLYRQAAVRAAEPGIGGSVRIERKSFCSKLSDICRLDRASERSRLPPGPMSIFFGQGGLPH